MNRPYSAAIRKAGGIPVLVPLCADDGATRAVVGLSQGLLITGGVDIHPRDYSEDTLPECGTIDELRDAVDRAAIQAALDLSLPTFGICRGIQSLAVYRGGSLYQDIPSQLEGPLPHRQKSPRSESTHDVQVAPDTLLAEITGPGTLSVNTFHHQSIKDIPPGFRVTAAAPDGVIEGIEANGGAWCVGVQWHPEEMAPIAEAHQALFDAFVRAAAG